MGCTGSKKSSTLKTTEQNQQLVTSISNNNRTDNNQSITDNSTKTDRDTVSNHSVSGDNIKSNNEQRDLVPATTDNNTTSDKDRVHVLTGFISEANQELNGNVSDNCKQPTNTMEKAPEASLDVGRPMGQEETSVKLGTLEESIKSLTSISEEDAREAIAMIEKHPDHLDDFSVLIGLKELLKRDPKKFCKRLHKPSYITPLMDFWAYTGGAKATVEVYAEQLKNLGVTYLTDTILNDCTADSVEAKNTWKKAIPVISDMRNFWVNSSDSSTQFAARLAQAGLFPYLAEDIQHLDKDFKSASDVFEEAVTILHNCARNKQLRQYFRDIGLVQLLTPYLSRKEKEIKLLCLLTISYIIDEEDNHLLLGCDSDFNFILEMISLAWATDSHSTYDGYHLEELLQGVGNLAQNDENKKLLMKKGAMIHLKPILKEGNDIEKQETAKIMWELAFDKENRRLMKADTELMKLLHDLENSSHRGVAKSSGGALWVLNMDNKVLKGAPSSQKSRSSPAPPPPPSAPPEEILCGGLEAMGPQSKSSPHPPPPPPPLIPAAEAQGHIMISYNWGNQKLLMQIRDSLRAKGFTIWMDVDNISGSTLQAMAEAVEGASAILMCMSQRYKDSPNCRTEADYAFALQKPIIPLRMERNYKPDGWLGILCGSKLFFDFSGKYPYEKKLDELVKELGNKGLRYDVSATGDSPVVAKPAATVASSVTVRKGVESWSNKDVHDWINNNHLQGCPKLQNLSGENIKFLQKLSQRAPEFYFTYLKHDLGLSSLDDLMHFSDAIDRLP